MKTIFRIAVWGLIVGMGLRSGAAAPPVEHSAAGAPLGDVDAGRVVIDNTVGTARQVGFGAMVTPEGLFGDGQGWEGNLFRVETLVPYHITTGRSVIVFMANGAVDESGRGIGNFGGGYRQYVPSIDRVFSFTGWFDIDDGRFHTFQRAGFSFSSKGRYLDFLLNLYAIVGDTDEEVARTFSTTPFVVGHNVLLTEQKIMESAYGGVDGLIGGPLPFLGRYGASAWIGGHWLTTPDDEDAAGPDVRFQQRFNDDVEVNVMWSYDDVFESNTFVTVSMAMPFGKRNGWFKRWFKPRKPADRMYDRVWRQPRIPRKLRFDDVDNVALLDPRDGRPVMIYFVQEGARPGGTGTAEDPAPTLASFKGLPDPVQGQFDIVLATGSSFQNPFTFFVNPGLRVLSSGIQQFVSTNLGVLPLPGTNTGVFPVVTNTAGGDVFMMGSGSELSAFIADGGGTGRPVFAANIAGVNINNVVARNSSDVGISLHNVFGTFAGGNPILLTANNASGNPLDGIRLVNDAIGGLAEVAMVDNVANSNGPLVGGIGIHIQTYNGNVIIADPSMVPGSGLIGNTTNFNGTGVRIANFSGGTSHIALIDHTSQGNADTSTGVNLSASGAGSLMNLTALSGSTITANNGFGLAGLAEAGGTVRMNNVVGNTISGNNAGNVRLRSLDAGSTLQASIGTPGALENQINGSSNGSGIEMLSSQGNMFVVVQNNLIGTAAQPNDQFGILGTFDGGQVNVTVGGTAAGTGNSIVGDGMTTQAGVSMVYSNTLGGPFAPQFDSGNNLITGMNGSGVSLLLQATNTNLTTDFISDTIVGNTGAGLLAVNSAADSSGEFALNVDSSNLSSNGGDGLNLTASNAGTISADITGSLFNGNGTTAAPANGITASVAGTSNLNLRVVDSQAAGNIGAGSDNGDGIQVNVSGSADANSIIIGEVARGNDLSNNEGDGLELNHTDTGTFSSVSVAGNRIALNQGNGILYDSDMPVTTPVASPFTGVFDSNEIMGNSLHGFFADIQGSNGTRANPSSITITNSTIAGNLLDGIRIVTDTNRVRPTQVGVNAVTFNTGQPMVTAHDPNSPQFALQLPAGTFMPPPKGRYLSLLTDIGIVAVVTDNQILDNGSNGASFLVGSDTYQAVDFSRNRATGNANVDFMTGSFQSGPGNTPPTTNAGGIDTLTLDATAQLDLRFLDNFLNRIDVSTTTALFYTDADAGKNFTTPNPWTFPDAFNNRPAFFYQVDNAAVLDARNTIIDGGVVTTPSTAFSGGRYFLNPASVWRDPGFPLNQPLP